jgi:hypothetical protein
LIESNKSDNNKQKKGKYEFPKQSSSIHVPVSRQ